MLKLMSTMFNSEDACNTEIFMSETYARTEHTNVNDMYSDGDVKLQPTMCTPTSRSSWNIGTQPT